ncbi:MAG: DUF6166 domain-containing protein [Gammaproteobacteria bacterium]
MGAGHYAGDRTIDGVVVTVDGQPLDLALDVKQFSTNGFEWSYEGAEPRQLALAILVDHLGDPTRAMTLSEAFMAEVVANFDNTWEMTAQDVASAVEAIEARVRAAGN